MKKCCGGSSPSCVCRKKTIIFDLDGVLADTLPVHKLTFNKAIESIIGKDYIINDLDYKKNFEGLTTNEKLKLLFNRIENLTMSECEKIYYKKQELTIQEYSKLYPNKFLQDLLNRLSKKFNLICCTNSNKEVAFLLLEKLGLLNYFNYILTSDDVLNKKPHPEVFWKAMSLVGSFPYETLILEDSVQGLKAATYSGTSVYKITTPGNISYDKILKFFNSKNKHMNVFHDDNLTVVIPMAGAGSRFTSAGYTLPKPLIDVDGRSMIRAVVDSLNIQANFIFLVLKEHIVEYNIDKILKEIVPTCNIVIVDSLTEGAVSTILTGRDLLNNDNPILIVNSDNIVLWDPIDFFSEVEKDDLDGAIVYFKDDDPKWSFVEIENNKVTRVAEKEVISNNATAGIYYWKKGKDFIKYADKMIQQNIRVNNEFYVAPVYNLGIEENMTIGAYEISREEMWGVGTPDDLKYYIDNNK